MHEAKIAFFQTVETRLEVGARRSSGKERICRSDHAMLDRGQWTAQEGSIAPRRYNRAASRPAKDLLAEAAASSRPQRTPLSFAE